MTARWQPKAALIATAVQVTWDWPRFPAWGASATTSTGSAQQLALNKNLQVGTLPHVYQGKIVNAHIVLGPQSNPTLLAETPPLPGGTYLVTATVGAVIGSQDNMVCAASNVRAGNDGVFGTAGNSGTAGDYGTAAMTDTIQVTAGQQISVTCNSTNFGQGTYAGSAVVEAVRVGQVN